MEVNVVADAQTLQAQTETRGAVPDEAVRLAAQQVSSLPRMAPESVLFARVKLTMAPDSAVEHPVIVHANIDLNGRLIRAQADDARGGRACLRPDPARARGAELGGDPRRPAGGRAW